MPQPSAAREAIPPASSKPGWTLQRSIDAYVTTCYYLPPDSGLRAHLKIRYAGPQLPTPSYKRSENNR